MIYLKTEEEIEYLREANQIVSRTFGEIAKYVAPGITTLELDRIAEECIRSQGAVPGFKGLYGFPGTMCISVNEAVVHGYPSNYVLKEGDIVSCDCGAVIHGFNGDSTYTFPVGEISEEARKLLRTTKESLYEGIAKALPGNRIGDISNAIQTYCEKRGYSVVRELTGHGVGKKLHEDPAVPNYGRRGVGPLIKNGMVIAIEPMINQGSKNVVFENGMECRTKDRKLSAHFEHSVAIHNDKADILSTFEYVEAVLGERAI